MNRRKTIFTAALFELLLILCVGCANLCRRPVFYFFFYHVLYGMLLSFLVPLFLLRKEKNSVVFLGIKPLQRRQYILLLFAVGLGFAAAFKLSGNHLIVAYFVNLPNALVTYLLKYEQFAVMTVSATIASAAAICSIIFVWILLIRAEKTKPPGSCSEK